MKRLLIAVFSTGWLLPMWISAWMLFGFLEQEIWPLLRGKNPMNSFPYVHYSCQAFAVGSIWLAAAVFFWSWRLSDIKRSASDGTAKREG